MDLIIVLFFCSSPQPDSCQPVATKPAISRTMEECKVEMIKDVKLVTGVILEQKMDNPPRVVAGACVEKPRDPSERII